MAKGKKTGGRRRGTPNKRTTARLELMGPYQVGIGALSEMRTCAQVLLDLMQKELAKDGQADGRLVKEYADGALRALKEVACYELPKLTAIRVGGDPGNLAPVNIASLSDSQLNDLIKRLSVGMTSS